MPRQSTCARAVHPPQRSMLSSSSSPSQMWQRLRTGTSWWAPLAPSALAPEAWFFWFRFGNTCCRCRLPRPSPSSPASANLEALDASRSTSATPFPLAASVDPEGPSSAPRAPSGSVDPPLASPISPRYAAPSPTAVHLGQRSPVEQPVNLGIRGFRRRDDASANVVSRVRLVRLCRPSARARRARAPPRAQAARLLRRLPARLLLRLPFPPPPSSPRTSFTTRPRRWPAPLGHGDDLLLHRLGGDELVHGDFPRLTHPVRPGLRLRVDERVKVRVVEHDSSAVARLTPCPPARVEIRRRNVSDPTLRSAMTRWRSANGVPPSMRPNTGRTDPFLEFAGASSATTNPTPEALSQSSSRSSMRVIWQKSRMRCPRSRSFGSSLASSCILPLEPQRGRLAGRTCYRGRRASPARRAPADRLLSASASSATSSRGRSSSPPERRPSRPTNRKG